MFTISRNILLLSISLLWCSTIQGQTSASIKGTILADGQPLEFATIRIDENKQGLTSDHDGAFEFNNIPYGTYTLSASYLGFQYQEEQVVLDSLHSAVAVNFELEETSAYLNQVVITGTKTFKRQTDSPVIVNVVSSKTLENVQACSLSEGLKFQPGLRVETDCQTCNYTQLRMNGLAGGYSQILINGRPIFSPLTGLYGLEQLPANMIDRIEVIRGGGSSLYGSSAIGGTVNVITKIPKKNSHQLNYFYQNINGQSSDHNLTANTTLVAKNKNTGVSFFLNHRNREMYDHNDDGFSEIPSLKNTSLGANFFLLPAANQKLEISISNINEYRYGGEMVKKPAHLTLQSEERTHHVWLGSADYQINFNEENTSFITYAAWQNTKRDHYTGIQPDEEIALQNHLDNSPYGISNTTTLQGGVQLNHRVNSFLGGENIFTFGGEYVVDDVFDEITAYQYLIDQVTKNAGAFLQSDWGISSNLNLLTGLRMDKHNLVDQVVFSPRASLLYKWRNTTQFRVSYGTGFRAPQAFDTDLHIAFAGGGISRVKLSPDLIEERSQSWTASVNFDKATEMFIAGFTLESFYTHLSDAFFLSPQGADEFGEIFEKQNGSGATVQGLTLEARANYKQKLQVEAGFTIQSSEYEQAVSYIDELAPTKSFMRTPNQYGFMNWSIMPSNRWNANINFVYTGEMLVPHFAGAPNQLVDEIITTKSFTEVNFKLAHTFPLVKSSTGLEFYGGIKNLFNAYQDDFDIGKNRDSNFVYGPGQARTFFIGCSWKSL